MTPHYTLMSCNGNEWIQPPSNQSRLPGCYGYYDPPAAIVAELNRLVDRIKRLEEAGDALEYASVILEAGEDPNGFELLLIAQREWLKAKEAKP